MYKDGPDRLSSAGAFASLRGAAPLLMVALGALLALCVAAISAAGATGGDPAPSPTATHTRTPSVVGTPNADDREAALWALLNPRPATPTHTPTATPTATATPTDTPVPPPPTATPQPPTRPPPQAPVEPTATQAATQGTAGLAPVAMDAYAQALFEATNARRSSAGLFPLRANGYLNAVARIRSKDMADHNYFAHESPVTGDSAFSLLDRYAVPYGYAGENLAKNNYPAGEAVAVADDSLWNSPPHKENILNPHYTDVGIALVTDASGMKYFTIVFTGAG